MEILGRARARAVGDGACDGLHRGLWQRRRGRRRRRRGRQEGRLDHHLRDLQPGSPRSRERVHGRGRRGALADLSRPDDLQARGGQGRRRAHPRRGREGARDLGRRQDLQVQAAQRPQVLRRHGGQGLRLRACNPALAHARVGRAQLLRGHRRRFRVREEQEGRRRHLGHRAERRDRRDHHQAHREERPVSLHPRVPVRRPRAGQDLLQGAQQGAAAWSRRLRLQEGRDRAEPAVRAREEQELRQHPGRPQGQRRPDHGQADQEPDAPGAGRDRRQARLHARRAVERPAA